MSDKVIIDRHLYLTKDGSRVVEEGDPAGRWLWASPGTEVPREQAVRLGAIQPPAEPEPEPAPAPKERPAAANKSRRPAANKET